MVTITIAGTDRTNLVELNSLRIDNVLTKEIDSCSFKIRKFGSRTFVPKVGNTVLIDDTGTTIFGGVIIRVFQETIGDAIVVYEVECSDYTRLLDQHLVAETYEDMTVNAIIADLIANWAPTGVTGTQVSCSIVVDYIQFKYEPVSDCLRQLAEMVGYDWYIDYDKDIYFKEPTATPASVDVQDDNGTYMKDSLVIRRDNTQMRNSVIVRGGEYLGAQFTSDIEADGDQIIFPLGYKYSDFEATLSTTALNIGIDYIDDPDNFDAMYNFNEKILRFKDIDKPSAGAILKVAGKPHLPVITKVKNQDLIDSVFSAEQIGDGRYEYLVIDKAINSKEGARARALAEIKTYGETLSEGNFDTETSGLRAGQRIRINSTIQGIDEYFIINKVTLVLATPTNLVYRISLITTKTMNFISVLKKLLLAETKKLEIKSDELLDLVEAADETITLTEVVAIASAQSLTETITMGESFVNNGLDFGTQFVLGPQTPATTKRLFVLGGSRLG